MVRAIGDRTGLVVVAQSFGASTAPLVCERVPVDLLVLLAGMVPAPGEPPASRAATVTRSKPRSANNRPSGVGDQPAGLRFLALMKAMCHSV